MAALQAPPRVLQGSTGSRLVSCTCSTGLQANIVDELLREKGRTPQKRHGAMMRHVMLSSFYPAAFSPFARVEGAWPVAKRIRRGRLIVAQPASDHSEDVFGEAEDPAEIAMAKKGTVLSAVNTLALVEKAQRRGCPGGPCVCLAKQSGCRAPARFKSFKAHSSVPKQLCAVGRKSLACGLLCGRDLS